MSQTKLAKLKVVGFPEAFTSIEIQSGLIKSVAPVSGDILADLGSPSDTVEQLWPGFIDVHCHGAVGIDVNDADAVALIEVSHFLAKNGVTAWMPTLVPDSDDNYRRIIDEIEHARELQQGRPVAQIVGVHYEGVFASEKMCGALRPQYFKTYTGAEAGALPKLSGDAVHMTTLAPEVEGGIELVTALVESGWVASIGHTRADTDTLEKAFAAGARHITHFFNAMTGIHHRDLGVAGWALTRDGVTVDIIADGRHVRDEMLRLVCGTKGVDGVTLISDSVAPTGLGDGTYRLWGENVIVAGGETRNERGSIAGSVISMKDAIKRMLSLGLSSDHVSAMASLNPARLLGLDALRGAIAPGMRADLVAIDDNTNVLWSMIGGELVT